MQVLLPIKTLVNNLEESSKDTPFTDVFGLSRSLFALGTLITLICNVPQALFIKERFLAAHINILEKINFFYLFGFNNLYLSQLLAIAILLSVVLGIYPRITGILHWWVSYSFFNSAIIIDGGDQITQIITLFFIPICLLDARRSHWEKDVKIRSHYRNYLALLIFFIIKIQISLLYFNAGIGKLNVPEWIDGSAMYYFLTDNTFGAPPYVKDFVFLLVTNSFIVWVLSWGTIIFEILLAASIFLNEKNKSIMFKLGLIFHLLIFILLGLGSFFFAMAGSLVVYLLPLKKNLNIKNFALWTVQVFTLKSRSLLKNG